MWSVLVLQGHCRVSLGKAGDNVTCCKDRADFGKFDEWREVLTGTMLTAQRDLENVGFDLQELNDNPV